MARLSSPGRPDPQVTPRDPGVRVRRAPKPKDEPNAGGGLLVVDGLDRREFDVAGYLVGADPIDGRERRVPNTGTTFPTAFTSS